MEFLTASANNNLYPSVTINASNTWATTTVAVLYNSSPARCITVFSYAPSENQTIKFNRVTGASCIKVWGLK